MRGCRFSGVGDLDSSGSGVLEFSIVSGRGPSPNFVCGSN